MDPANPKSPWIPHRTIVVPPVVSDGRSRVALMTLPAEISVTVAGNFQFIVITFIVDIDSIAFPM